MGQQHAQGYVAAARVVPCKFGDDGGDGGVQVEKSAFVEDHRHGGGGDGFRDRSQVEDAGGGDRWRSWIVGETAEGVVGDEFSARVTATAQPGKARSAMAFSRSANAS